VTHLNSKKKGTYHPFQRWGYQPLFSETPFVMFVLLCCVVLCWDLSI